MFNHLSIAKRLSLGFGLLLLILFATNTNSILKMSGLMKNFHTVSEDEMPKMLNAEELVIISLEMNGLMQELLIVKTQEERERIRNEIMAVRTKNADVLKILNESIARQDIKSILNKGVSTRQELLPLYTKVFEVLETDPEEARRLVMEEVDPRLHLIISQMKEVNSALQVYVTKSVSDAETSFQSAQMLAISATSFGMLMGLLLAYLITRSISRPLSLIQQTVSTVQAHNDFTVTSDIRSHDEVGTTAKAFNGLLQTLRDLLAEVKKSITEVSSASENLVSASNESARASENTSEASASMASSVEEMTVSIAHVSENAQSASDLAIKAGKLSDDGGKVINDTVSGMRKIADTVDEVAKAIGELGEQSDKISNIVQVIREVADQTNLLALNAAIEAARAGEAGRGFAVVADEVRKLAERTTTATSDIAQMIGGIQSCSDSAIGAMHKTVEQVQAGRELAKEAGKAIAEIRKASNEVVEVVGNIALSLNEQSAAAHSISRQLETVSQGSEENSASAGETSDAANRLGALAHNMQVMADRFKT